MTDTPLYSISSRMVRVISSIFFGNGTTTRTCSGSTPNPRQIASNLFVPAELLSTGHGGSQVIRNHHRDIGTVIHRIQQTGHTGMSEGRVTDNSNRRKYPYIGSTFGHGYGSTHIHTTVDSTRNGGNAPNV